jgi:hypothetical protein
MFRRFTIHGRGAGVKVHSKQVLSNKPPNNFKVVISLPETVWKHLHLTYELEKRVNQSEESSLK